jgi:hypothetical protein
MYLWTWSSSLSSLISWSICWTSSEGSRLALQCCWWIKRWDVLWILVILGRLGAEFECRFTCSLVAIIVMGDGNHTSIPFLLLYICWVRASRVVVFDTKRESCSTTPIDYSDESTTKPQQREKGEIKIERRRSRKIGDRQRWVVLYSGDRLDVMMMYRISRQILPQFSSMIFLVF